MHPIRIYDDTVPIACTATSDELPIRIDQIERLRRHHTGLDRTPHGILLHFPKAPEVEADVASFSVEEKSCCAFWGFATTSTDDDIVLRWDGPPAVRAFFDELVSFFESDEPLAAFPGLL